MCFFPFAAVQHGFHRLLRQRRRLQRRARRNIVCFQLGPSIKLAPVFSSRKWSSESLSLSLSLSLSVSVSLSLSLLSLSLSLSLSLKEIGFTYMCSACMCVCVCVCVCFQCLAPTDIDTSGSARTGPSATGVTASTWPGSFSQSMAAVGTNGQVGCLL